MWVIDDTVASVHSSATVAILLTQIGKARLGENILIHGAVGNVGTKLVSIAHQMWMSVTTTSRPVDFAMLHSLGANNTLDFCPCKNVGYMAFIYEAR